jgi:3alpha(or 20beta)-hydroxysteroid dehydrogenase
LEGRVALVTGAARGIGAAIARTLHREGARVVVADVRAAEGHGVAEELGAGTRYVDLDVADERAWGRVLAEHGTIDVLVNNAAINVKAPLLDVDLSDYHRIVAVNQTGVFLGMRSVLPGMLVAGRGAIVSVSSIDGMFGTPGNAVYCATKHAVLGMTRALSMEVAGRGIRVNAVCPGGVRTSMMVEMEQSTGKDIEGTISAHTPMGRIARTDEIAEAVAFLASDRASYCTGTHLVVDGGWTAGWDTSR